MLCCSKTTLSNCHTLCTVFEHSWKVTESLAQKLVLLYVIVMECDVGQVTVLVIGDYGGYVREVWVVAQNGVYL